MICLGGTPVGKRNGGRLKTIWAAGVLRLGGSNWQLATGQLIGRAMSINGM